MRGALAYVGAAILAAAMFAGGGVSGCVFYLNPLCTDQIRNGEETGIDCGGTCGPCAIGASCGKDTDCDDSFCKGGTCTAFPCGDGQKGEQETDVPRAQPTHDAVVPDGVPHPRDIERRRRRGA